MTQRGRKSLNKLQLVVPGYRASDKEPPPPPTHLGKVEQQLWRDLLDENAIDTRAGLTVLTVALEAHERARLCAERIKRDGLLTKGRDDQDKAHPLIAHERAARQQYVVCLRKLGLEL